MAVALRFAAVALIASVLAGPAGAEPFFIEMRDGTFTRCGNLSFREKRAEWRLQGCDPVARLFVGTLPIPKPTALPSPTPKPTAEPCRGGCWVWDPTTDTVTCERPCVTE